MPYHPQGFIPKDLSFTEIHIWYQASLKYMGLPLYGYHYTLGIQEIFC